MRKQTLDSYLENFIEHSEFVIGGNDDGPQETTGGSRKRRYRKHWWQLWRKRE